MHANFQRSEKSFSKTESGPFSFRFLFRVKEKLEAVDSVLSESVTSNLYASGEKYRLTSKHRVK